MDAVDDGLGFLDDNGKKALYYQVEKRCKIRRENIPQELEAFQNALEGLFGPGSKFIENEIVRSLYGRLNLTFKEYRGWKIKEYVDHAQKKRLNPKSS